MKKHRDVKFIIYQALYIFVICVIAIKGADINLDEVEIKKLLDPRFAYIDTLENKVIRKEDLAKMIIFDSTKYLIVSKEDYRNNPQQYANNPLVVAGNLNPINDNTLTNPKIEVKDEKKEPTEITDIRIGNIQLTQFTQNTLTNPYDVAMEISGITTIPPKSSKSFTTGGESSVVIKVGSSAKTIELKPNEKPKISFSRVTSMGEETRVSTLQSNVGYRVTISDDFAGQLEVKFNGPVTVKQQGTTYDVTMNAFGSKAAFDNFTDNKESPYQTGFTVTVKDKIAGHTVTGQNSFIFGEW